MQPALALWLPLLPLLLVLPGQTQNLQEESTLSSVNCNQKQPVYELVKNVPGSVDENGLCHCVVHLPNNLAPLKQLEQLQAITQELMHKYEQELSREAPTYSLLRLELEGARELVTQLTAKGGGSVAEDLLSQLQSQVANASLSLKLLADSDQRNLRAYRQEVDVLESRLIDCERERWQEASGPPLPPGSCAHGGLQRVSRPLVVQLNWRGFSHKAGAWGRDSTPNPDSSLYWVAPLSSGDRYFDYYRLYKSYDDLVLMKNYVERSMGYGDGSGNTVYENFMYFNYYGTRDIAKVNLSSNTLLLRRPLPSATYNNRFSYAGVSWKDIDFAGDEKGLWVLYATEESKGNLVVSRLNTSTLEVEKTWRTSQYKPAMSGAFMACGVLYALRPLSTRQEEIFYAFDTTTGRERRLSILLDKMLETLHGINYSPSDHKLYVYNDGYLINYDLSFLTLKHKQSKLPAGKFSWLPTVPHPVTPKKTSRP
ncbi:olfactomedin-4-like [Ursus americanus]|uniref:Olfactomedin-4 isoform X1 n=1 Tax=Ursus maritimus TaxID=29073 RepID=A0A384DLJ0_URSMA|nr:olfactomedin-4 isoform X1 [Ursus maritimus]XP_026345421.2 olfactomedin-4-like [Ursus arctos]XP_045638931.1 olfactomedin-4-like [Ursus americanus]